MYGGVVVVSYYKDSSNVASTRRPWVITLRIAQPEELCAVKQSPSSKIRESKLWNIKEQFGRGFNLAATSALGHVTVALASAAPLDATLINKLTDDKRSVVFDGALRSLQYSKDWGDIVERVPLLYSTNCACVNGRHGTTRAERDEMSGINLLCRPFTMTTVSCDAVSSYSLIMLARVLTEIP